MESSSKRQQEVDPNEHDLYIVTEEIQNRCDQPLIALGTKNQCFCESFGCGAAVALMLWKMLSTHDLVPPEGQIIHALWTLYFLKQYPKQDAGCAAVGRSRKAINPKTFRKYVHPFIYAIASLEIYVVSIFIFSNSSCSIIFLFSNQILQNIFLESYFYRYCLTTISKVMFTMIA